MRVRRLLIGVSVITLLGLLPAGATAARSERQSALMMWHGQTGLSGPVGSGASAKLVRRSDGVSFHINTQHLRAGHAYTVWFVVLNNPDACLATPCSAVDILQRAETDAQVTYGAGHVIGGSGRAGFAAAFRSGPIDGWLAGGGLHDPRGAEIQLVINDHGPELGEVHAGHDLDLSGRLHRCQPAGHLPALGQGRRATGSQRLPALPGGGLPGLLTPSARSSPDVRPIRPEHRPGGRGRPWPPHSPG